MIQNLLQLMEKLEYEEDGWTSITSANWSGSDLVLQFRVQISDAPPRVWSIHCGRPRSYRILALENDDLVDLVNDHIVLWPHVQKQGELYFYGTPTDAFALLGELVEKHKEMVGNWFPFDLFLNLPGRVSDIFRSGHGLVAKGPVQLLDAYAKILDNHHIRHSMLPPCDPLFWDGVHWIPESPQLQALLIGESYVVAPSFHAKEITEHDEPPAQI
ncbi:MAG: hypothetical protein ACKVT0_17930 [Planctomycetaceae bacterium]